AGTATSTVTPRPGISRAGSTLDGLKQACETAIDRRLTSLGDLQGKVSSSTYLTAGGRATLLGEIRAEHDGLAALRIKIAAGKDAKQVVADLKALKTPKPVSPTASR